MSRRFGEGTQVECVWVRGKGCVHGSVCDGTSHGSANEDEGCRYRELVALAARLCDFDESSWQAELVVVNCNEPPSGRPRHVGVGAALSPVIPVVMAGRRWSWLSSTLDRRPRICTSPACHRGLGAIHVGPRDSTGRRATRSITTAATGSVPAVVAGAVLVRTTRGVAEVASTRASGRRGRTISLPWTACRTTPLTVGTASTIRSPV
jgi:hypothetical protein